MQTLYSVRLAAVTASSLLGYDTVSLAHLYLGSFSHSFLQILSSCQVGWGASLHSYFQIYPEMLNRVQVHTLAGPLKDIETLPEATPVLSWLCA